MSIDNWKRSVAKDQQSWRIIERPNNNEEEFIYIWEILRHKYDIYFKDYPLEFDDLQQLMKIAYKYEQEFAQIREKEQNKISNEIKDIQKKAN